MAGVLESLLAGVACFFLPSFSILPVAVPGVGAMLGVEELWLGSSAFFFLAVILRGLDLVPASSALLAPPGLGCMLGFELDWALAASALTSKAAAASASVLDDIGSLLKRMRGGVVPALRAGNAGWNRKVPFAAAVRCAIARAGGRA